MSIGGGPATRAIRGLVGGDAPLTWKIFLANAAVVLAILAGALLVLSAAARATADASLDRGLEQTRRHVATLLAERERTLAGRALVFVQSPTFRALVMAQSPADLLDQATEAEERTGAGWVQITDPEGVRLAKSDEPTAPKVSLAGSALIAEALSGEPSAGFGASGDTLLFQAVAVPIIGTTSVSGVLMATVAVDSSFGAAVKDATGSDIIFYVIDTANATRVSSATLPVSAELDELVRRLVSAADVASDTGIAGRDEASLGEHAYLARAQLVRSAGGDVLGGFALLRSRDAELAPFHLLRRWILAAGLLGLALAFPLSYVVARRITRPVLELVDATKRIASGDYSRDVPVRSADEVGTLADAVHSLQVELRDKQSLVDFLLTSQELARQGQDGGPSSSGRATPIGLLARGTVLNGRFAIDDVLGEGGTGVIYRAIDRELGETVAIKTLRPGLVADDPTALERLKSEIRLARRLSHRNIVRIHDFGETDGLHFITMELVAGTPLTALIRRQGRLPVAGTLSVGKQLCRALQAAHEQGIVHRDIKPHNLMLQPDGVLKVLDFGVARLVRRTSAALTKVGMVVGTPEYMAPEQLLDEDVDGRADLYAMGVVLYECLTGQRPIDGDSVPSLIARILAERPVPPRERNPDVPAELSALVMRLLARDRGERPRTAADVLQAVEGLE
jgi:eukaryotic-like serine/threonine-protein kinase